MKNVYNCNLCKDQGTLLIQRLGVFMTCPACISRREGERLQKVLKMCKMEEQESDGIQPNN